MPRNDHDHLTGSGITVAAVLLGCLALTALVAQPFSRARERAATIAERRWAEEVLHELQPVIITPAPRIEQISSAAARVLTMYAAHRDAKRVAYALRVVTNAAYNDHLEFAVAVDPQGRILNLLVLEHHETRGFGDVIADPDAPFIKNFAGRSLAAPQFNGWALRSAGGKFDGISGATITATALINATRDALIVASAAASAP